MIRAYIEGGARGNPGPAGYGVRIEDADGALIAELFEPLGVATTNVADDNEVLADLRWAATRLQRLTEQQWRDIFRAANYTDAVRDRYLRKIRQKIQEALKVAATAQTTPDV